MSENSAIEWCHHTFNPWWGCIEVSPACDNCYARTFAKRVGQKVWGPAGETPRRFFADKHWAEPLKWDQKAREAGERRRVFCASMADVFEQNDALDPHRERLWDLISDTPMLDWLLLTKRPQNIMRMIPMSWTEDAPFNVWYGTTVEDQHYADQRIPILLDVPAVVRFLSMEPLLGPVDLWSARYALPGGGLGSAFNWGNGISWVITGGESGHGARYADPDWYRAIRDDCQAAGVPFLFKQWGDLDETGRRVGKKAAGRLLDGVEHSAFPRPAELAASRGAS